MTELKYRRVLLKLSGEALMGDRGFGIDPKVVDRLAGEIVEAHRLGIQVGVVVGGGNIFRGVSVAADGGDRTTGDYLGMLGTVMNALAMRSAIERLGEQNIARGQRRLRRDCQTSTCTGPWGSGSICRTAVCGTSFVQTGRSSGFSGVGTTL